MQDAPCQDSRVYSISWTINQERNDRVSFVGCGIVGQSSHHPCKFTIFHSKSFFKKSKLDIYKCPFLDFLKYFWEFDVL